MHHGQLLEWLGAVLILLVVGGLIVGFIDYMSVESDDR